MIKFLSALFFLVVLSAANATQTEVQHVVIPNLTCGTSCPAQTLTLGAGNLLFIEATPLYSGATISSITCSPNCGTFTVPGAACRATTTVSQGIDCAYTLSTIAGTTSITVNLSTASVGSVDLFFREYKTTATGGFKSAVISASPLASCATCTTPSVAVTGTAVLIAGGGPGQGSFSSINAPFTNFDIGGSGTGVGDILNAAAGTGATLNQSPADTASVFTAAFMDSGSSPTQHIVAISCTPSADSTASDPGTTVINRAVSPSTTYTVLTSTAPPNCAFNDSTVVSGTTYNYYAQALIDGQQSVPSNTITVSVPSNQLVTPIVTVTLASGSITKNTANTATIKVSGATTPTGTVRLAGSSFSSTATLNAGSAVINIPSGSFNAGTYTLTATYTPDTTSSTVYTSATGTVGLVVKNGPPSKLAGVVQ